MRACLESLIFIIVLLHETEWERGWGLQKRGFKISWKLISWSWFKFNNLERALSIALKFYTSMVMMIVRVGGCKLMWPTRSFDWFSKYYWPKALNKQKSRHIAIHPVLRYYIIMSFKFWFWASLRFWQRQGLANNLHQDRHYGQVLVCS